MPRTHTKTYATISVFIENIKSIIKIGEDENSATVNILIARILVYSAIKISAKGPLLYSVLNPETSSDSPSAKSKGVRFVSANIVINQIKNIGRSKNIFHVKEKKEEIRKLYELNNISADNKIRVILTSYEMVCAILRSAPISEYFEFDAHPAPSVA